VKIEAANMAAYEVQLYENHIELLISVHKESTKPINWGEIAQGAAPEKPQLKNAEEGSAQKQLAMYKPNILDQLFRLETKKRQKLLLAVEAAKQRDQSQYQEENKNHENAFNEWTRQKDLATRVLRGDPHAYVEVIEELNPFEEISSLGSSVVFQTTNATYVEATVKVNGDQVIPGEVKTLLKSGKVSTKKMPPTQFFGLYEEHVCSCLFRVARELFALLSVEHVFAHAEADLLNQATGHKENSTLVSVMFTRDTMTSLDLDKIDCSAALKNFVHNIQFAKTKGFAAVTRILPTQFSGRQDPLA